MKALSKVSIRVNYIIKSNIIEKISNILIGKKSLLSLSLLLKKHNKDFEKGATAAKHTSVLIGNLLITSIYLTIAFGTAGPAIIGAKLLHLMVKAIIPVVKLLSKNNKQINKSVKPALMIAAFTGIMLVTTFMLAAIATRGIEALLGAVVLYGVAFICSKIFKLLDDTKKEILIGAISMAIMAGSLILFGIALQKICDATKDVSWKQVGIIATMTVLLGGVVAILGIPAVTPFILLGALSSITL